MKIFLIDMDGVLVDYHGKLCEIAREKHGATKLLTPDRFKNYNIEVGDFDPTELKGIQKARHDPELFEFAHPLPHVINEFPIFIRKFPNYRICTTPNVYSPGSYSGKMKWIFKYFGQEAVNRLIMTVDKTLIIGDVLIDDNPHISGCKTPTWKQWLYPQIYNSSSNLKRLSWNPESKFYWKNQIISF